MKIRLFPVWSDTRTEQTTEDILKHIPNQNPNHFKHISGEKLNCCVPGCYCCWTCSTERFYSINIRIFWGIFAGLSISPYFSALKIKWLIDNVPAVSSAFTDKTCLIGTIDTWLIWVRAIYL